MAMETGCLEVVVNRKPSTLIRILRVLAIIFAVCFLFLSFSFSFIMIVPAIICIVAEYYANLNSVIDYEYVYVDKEIRIAKILQKRKRKELGSYNLEQMELLAPISSDRFRSTAHGQKYRLLDYSSGTVQNPDRRYALLMRDNTELILDLDNEYGRTILDNVRVYFPGKTVRA